MQKIDTDVGKLVRMIEDGELQLPEMQRRYIWPATRVRDLLDSLYRGYPSGAILVWETDLEMPTRELAVPQSSSPFRGHKLLLDGQQRLTSLTAILRGKPVTVRGRKRSIQILFNLEHPEGLGEVSEVEDDTEVDLDVEGTDTDGDESPQNLQQRLNQRTFVVENSALKSDPRWVPVSDVFTGEMTDAQILRPLVSSFDDPKFDRYAKRLQNLRKIREYPYVMHVLDKLLSYEEVAEIFVRVNSLGMKLRGSDLALAQITSRWQNSLRLFEEFQEECDEGGFNTELGVLIRALVVFATDQSRFKTVGTIPIDKLKDGWGRAKDGLRFAMNFLRANAKVESDALLSSPLFLITVAYYGFQKRFSISPAEEASLRKWLYIASARSHYSASSETILDADLNAIRKNNDLIESLELQLGRLHVEAADLEGRGRQSALLGTAYLAVKSRGAKDWRSQLDLSLSHHGDHSIEYHHIFPRRLLKKAGYEASEINEIANMAFISGGTNKGLSATPASEYLAEVLEKQGKEALLSHCIPVDPELWDIEAYPKFLEFRRAALAQAINEFFATGGNTRALDTRSVIATGENECVEFKSSARWDYKTTSQNPGLEAVIAKTVAGLCNAKGGILLIGVDDSGAILGIQKDYETLSSRPNRDGYQQFLVNLLSSTLGREACASVSISIQSVDGCDICAIQVPKSSKPIYFREGQQSRFFLRVGNTIQELNLKESVDYIGKHWR
jgi:hypothetical protein